MQDDPERFAVLVSQRRAALLAARRVQHAAQDALSAAATAHAQLATRLDRAAAPPAARQPDLLRERRRQRHLARLRTELVAMAEQVEARRLAVLAADEAVRAAERGFEQMNALHQRAHAHAQRALRRRRLRLEEDGSARAGAPWPSKAT